jgi:hypothetical protein
MEYSKKYRRVQVTYDAAPDKAVGFLGGIYNFAKSIGFYSNPSSGDFEYVFFRGDGTEVVDTIKVTQTQRNVRVELRGWPFLGEDQLINYFKSYGLNVEYRYRFTVTINSRQKIQQVIEETLQQVGINKYFTVDVLSRIRLVEVRVIAIDEYGMYCAEVFFDILKNMPD